MHTPCPDPKPVPPTSSQQTALAGLVGLSCICNSKTPAFNHVRHSVGISHFISSAIRPNHCMAVLPYSPGGRHSTTKPPIRMPVVLLRMPLCPSAAQHIDKSVHTSPAASILLLYRTRVQGCTIYRSALYCMGMPQHLNSKKTPQAKEAHIDDDSLQQPPHSSNVLHAGATTTTKTNICTWHQH